MFNKGRDADMERRLIEEMLCEAVFPHTNKEIKAFPSRMPSLLRVFTLLVALKIPHPMIFFSVFLALNDVPVSVIIDLTLRRESLLYFSIGDLD